LITRLSHATLFVLDYDKALTFYRDKLGFEVRIDMPMDGGARWLTVGPKGQPELEIVLYQPMAYGNMDAETAAHLRAVLEKGMMGAGVFEADDCQKTYEELKAKGVEFLSPPKNQPYGIEAVFKDGLGNWFSLTQRR
jgi:catechol 2,3-dioxygenase-like lactoylglutathione lyase family enzyme